MALTSAPICNLPPTASMAVSIKTYGTNKAISVSGEAEVTVAAMSAASVVASVLLCGFNFQLPEIKGRRVAAPAAISRALLIPLLLTLLGLLTRDTKDGANAAEEETRAARERAVNFMMVLVLVSVSDDKGSINDKRVYADGMFSKVRKDLVCVTHFRI
jgi:hypothetical protein